MTSSDQTSEQVIPDSPWRAAAEIQIAGEPVVVRAMCPDKNCAQNLQQELEVHQVELEMQNEALRQTKLALEESRDRYVDLYEFAPIGYLTLTGDGIISSINLTGAAFLGRDRRDLLRRHFSAFVIPEDQERWALHFLGVKERDGQCSVEIALQRNDGTISYAQIASMRQKVGNTPESNSGTSEVRIALSDINERKQAEAELRESEAHLLQLTHYLQQVREEDRTHFARELHDDLGQNLTALRIDFNVLAAELGAKNPAVIARLAAIDQMIYGTVDAVRRICEDLRPGVLDDLGLEAALATYVKRFAKQSGVACDLALGRDDFALDDATSTAIFRIVQESLTNIARHARASHAMLALQDYGNDVLLTIADDGCGLSSALGGERRNYGLLGMRERVNRLGGHMAIDSAPGRGTHIEVSIPKKQKETP